MGTGETDTTEMKWSAIEYEYLMYFESKRLKCIEPARGYYCNSAVELQLLHARILAEFLTRTQKSQPDLDDVLLSEVIPNPPVELTDAICKLKEEYGERGDINRPRGSINKRLAHLTDIRGDRFDHAPLIAILEGPLEAALRLVAENSGRNSLLAICNFAASVAPGNSQIVASTSSVGMDHGSPIPFHPGTLANSSDSHAGVDSVVTIHDLPSVTWVSTDPEGSDLTRL